MKLVSKRSVAAVALLVVLFVGQSFGCKVTLEIFANSRCDGSPAYNHTVEANGRCYFDEHDGENIVAKVHGDVLTVTVFESDSKCVADRMSAEPTRFRRGACTDLGGEQSAVATWPLDGSGCDADFVSGGKVKLPTEPIGSEAELVEAFEVWAALYGKTYQDDGEYALRLEVFNQSLARIAAQNANAPKHGARFGLTKFADQTPEEFRKAVLMVLPPESAQKLPVAQPPSNLKAPASFDWRSKNAVTPVKDQGQCGSCWAFSATETLESAWIIAGNSEVILGPQQLVDCDTTSQGCNGGWPTAAWQYLQQCGGQETEQDYPYQGTNGQCAFDKTKIAATVGSIQSGCDSGDEQTLQSNLVSVSPISIIVDATAWQDYSGGVMTGQQCNGQNLDHAVQLVGYDTTQNPPYWIVRNSWNTNWGEQGYIYLEMWQNTCLMSKQTSLCSSGKNPSSSSSTSSSSASSASSASSSSASSASSASSDSGGSSSDSSSGGSASASSASGGSDSASSASGGSDSASSASGGSASGGSASGGSASGGSASASGGSASASGGSASDSDSDSGSATGSAVELPLVAGGGYGHVPED